MDKFRRITLQSAAALAYCHQLRILHKDIKPGNFFFRDKDHNELVLGDFGISSMLEDDGKAHKTTQARTPIYAAPEMYSDVIDGVVEISAKADFYSLGISLMTLWLGESPMSTNERVMMRQKNEGRIPRMNELPERIKLLVMGLTVVNPINRGGYEQVEQWFLGESPKVDLSSPFLKYKSFIVDPERNLVADNIHELVPLLLANEKEAIGYLYNGRITQWLEACGNSKLSTIVKDIITKRYPIDQRAGLMASVYAMEPTYPYRDLRGSLCDDVHSICISLLSNQDEYALTLNNENDSFYLYVETHTSCDVERLRSYFKGIDRTNKDEVRVAIMKIVLEVDPEIPFMVKHTSSTINEIVDAELKPIVRRKQRRLQTGHACVPFGRERRKRQIEFNPFAVAFIQFAELLLVVFLLFTFFMGDQNIDENVAELAASVAAIDARIVRVVFNRRQIVLKPAELEFLCRQRHLKKILVCREFRLHVDFVRPFVNALHIAEHVRTLRHKARPSQQKSRQQIFHVSIPFGGGSCLASCVFSARLASHVSCLMSKCVMASYYASTKSKRAALFLYNLHRDATGERRQGQFNHLVFLRHRQILCFQEFPI